MKVSNNDVGDALARLNGILSRNKVRAQLYLAQRHEKKGVKRRRLESERWRRQFAHEVRNFPDYLRGLPTTNSNSLIGTEQGPTYDENSQSGSLSGMCRLPTCFL